MLDIGYDSISEGIDKLIKYVKIRNSLCGKSYWFIFNYNCIKLGFSLIKNGANRKDIIVIMNM